MKISTDNKNITEKLQYFKKPDFEALLGKNKSEIVEFLGHGFNFIPYNEWHFLIKISWFGRRTILFIFFDNGIANSIVIKKTFKKIY